MDHVSTVLADEHAPTVRGRLTKAWRDGNLVYTYRQTRDSVVRARVKAVLPGVLAADTYICR